MKIETHASIDIARPVEKVFDLATDHTRLGEFMKKTGPIPGVVGIEMENGQKPATGARRRVSMTDKSTVGEEILSLDRPSRHAYRWTNPPAFPFSLLVRGAQADWRFSSMNGGSKIDWTYTFELTSFLAYPLGVVVVKLFRGWMNGALGRMRDTLERS